MGNALVLTRVASWALGVRNFFASTALRRGLTLTVVILMLQGLVFVTFYTGENIPPYDFIGAYAGDAFVWWTDGGFFNRTEWVPYVWAGYPSAAGIQNSGWYLPTGLLTLFGPYNLHMAAILAALHVAFGAYGMYLLLRTLRASFSVSLFASVALFFGVGFYSNASHIDIARGYAWLPWILLVLTPLWKWNKWWSIPVASLIIWQALTGIYPGMAASAVYSLLPWVVMICLIYRPKFKEFLLPLVISAAVALLLSMPRLLPYVLLSDGGSQDSPEASFFTPSILGTMLFGYGPQYDMPNDVTMRSFFVPITVIVLALFARWSDPLCKLGLALGVPAVLLGLPFFPWFAAVQNLPGLTLSRYTMSDFKLFMVVGAMLLACSGLRTLVTSRGQARVTRGMWISLTGAWLLLLGFGLLALRGPQAKSDDLPPLILLGLVLVCVTAFIFFNRGAATDVAAAQTRRALAMAFAVTMIMLTATSGVMWAYTTPNTWRVNRVYIEDVTYGQSIDSLIGQRAANTQGLTQRPARVPLPADFTAQNLYDNRGNAAFFSAKYSIAGYVNFKRSESHSALEKTLLESEIRQELAAFLAMPGSLLAVQPDGSVSREALNACASGDDCGVDATPLRYAPGEYGYRISLNSPTTAVLNEAYFPGWTAEACFDGKKCETLAPEVSQYGILQIALPAGDYDLSLSYAAPGRTAGWALFTAGLVVLLGTVVTILLAPKHKKATDSMTDTVVPVPFNDLGRIDSELQQQLVDTTARVIGGGWFVMGPEHNALEQELADFVGVDYTLLVANGTDALVLALRALEVGPGDLVLTCANAGGYTTIATGIVGATPVYADVDSGSLLMGLGEVKTGVDRAIEIFGKQPACIVVTHLFGASADIGAITDWAHQQGIPVVEDCAQALGGYRGAARLGSIADIATTSFYPTKNLGALGDAGAVFTNRDDLAARLRSLRQYGWDRKYHNAVPGGMNSRCDEMQAAILRLKLRRLDEWNEQRRSIHAKYEAALNSSSVRLLNSSQGEYVGHLAVLVTEDRETTAKVFADHGIKTDIHYPICDHLQPIAEPGRHSLPVSEAAAEHILSIPLFAELTEEETDRVAAALRVL